MTAYPRKDDFVYYVGRFLTAEWFYTREGKMSGADYYKALPAPDRGRFYQIVKLLCESPFGTFLPKTMYRIEDNENKIYALKPNDERFFNFTAVGGKIIITNAYHKHSQQMTKIDLECLKVAVRCRQDYLVRTEEGTYYEKN